MVIDLGFNITDIRDLDGALCYVGGYDPALWFGEDHEGRSNVTTAAAQERTRAAKAVCAQCPVRVRCLESALHEKYGVWGGLTAEERAELLKKRGDDDAA